MKHDLKVCLEYFQAIWIGDKTFEIRKNDRDFKERDEIVLSEFNERIREYTGREVHGFITYLTNYEQKPNYVVFAFEKTLHRDA